MEFDFEVIGPLPHQAVLQVKSDWDDETRYEFATQMQEWMRLGHKATCDIEHETAAEFMPLVVFWPHELQLLDEDAMREAGWVRA